MSPDDGRFDGVETGMRRAELLRLAGFAGAAVAAPAVLGRDRARAAGGRAAELARRRDISTLNWGLSTTPRSLDYIHSFDLATPTIMAIALESLLRIGPDGKLQPSLAKSWHQPDPLTYVYDLRPGVTFWDGTPLTADDVVFSMSKHLDPKAASELASYYVSVKSIKATSPTRVTIKLSTPDALFQYVPGIFAGLVVQKKFWEAHAKDIGTAKVLTMGTGPYKIVEYIPDQRVSLERNERYWGPKPAAQKIVLSFIPQESTRLLAMQSGQLDGAFEVPADQYAQWTQLPHTTVHSAPGLETEFFMLDTRSKPFDDVHVRRAIAHCLDRKGLVNAVLHGRGQVSESIAPPITWSTLLSQPEIRQFYKSLPVYDFDIAKAKQELAKSTVPKGFSATFTYPDSFPEQGKAALSLAQNLKQIGVTLDVQEQPFNKWLAISRANSKFNMTSGIWFMDYLDPANVMYNFVSSRFAKRNGLNGANYKNPSADRLLEAQRRARSPVVRARALKQVARLIASDVPYIPIFLPSIAMAINSKYRYSHYGPLYIYQNWAQYITAV